MYHVFRIHPFVRFFWALLMALAGLLLLRDTHIIEGIFLLVTSVFIVIGLLRRGRAYLGTWHG